MTKSSYERVQINDPLNVTHITTLYHHVSVSKSIHVMLIQLIDLENVKYFCFLLSSDYQHMSPNQSS